MPNLKNENCGEKKLGTHTFSRDKMLERNSIIFMLNNLDCDFIVHLVCST